MMARSPDSAPDPGSRRRRYTRRPVAKPAVLSPLCLRLLALVAAYGRVTTVQLGRRLGRSAKQLQPYTRRLFDLGLVEAVSVPRAVLADPNQAYDPRLSFGSAPNVLVLTTPGRRALQAAGMSVPPGPVKALAPSQGFFLAHELLTTDVRIWIELNAERWEEHRLHRWRSGRDAWIGLGANGEPAVCRPDAWFIYGVGRRVLVGLVEADRGSERSERFLQKLPAYEGLFASNALVETTGFQNARLLIVCPTLRRCRCLADLLSEHASAELCGRAWLAERTVLERPTLAEPVWLRPNRSGQFAMLNRQGSVAGEPR
jgi:hypothetical protein